MGYFQITWEPSEIQSEFLKRHNHFLRATQSINNFGFFHLLECIVDETVSKLACCAFLRCEMRFLYGIYREHRLKFLFSRGTFNSYGKLLKFGLNCPTKLCQSINLCSFNIHDTFCLKF